MTDDRTSRPVPDTDDDTLALLLDLLCERLTDADADECAEPPAQRPSG